MSEQIVLEIKELSLGYTNPLFKPLNLTIGRGQFITIMGENGTGKSSLIDCIAGSLNSMTGEILFWGKPRASHNNALLNSKIGWVISEKENYPPLLKIKDVLSALQKIYSNFNQALANKLLKDFELDSEKAVSTLSLGEVSKLKLLKALAFEPELLILDELTANLSSPSKKVALETLLNLFEKNKMSVLYVCHSNEEAIRLSDEIYSLSPAGLAKGQVL